MIIIDKHIMTANFSTTITDMKFDTVKRFHETLTTMSRHVNVD